jgi:hypothetical protein
MMQESEKKIIVDEDWKSQVEREREEALKTPAGTDSGAGTESGDASSSDRAAREADLPPASLSYLASSLYFQASIFLGLMPNPANNKLEKNISAARHAIDMLEVLQQKTEGNRTADETDEIEAMLHQLRMAFVQMAK